MRTFTQPGRRLSLCEQKTLEKMPRSYFQLRGILLLHTTLPLHERYILRGHVIGNNTTPSTGINVGAATVTYNGGSS